MWKNTFQISDWQGWKAHDYNGFLHSDSERWLQIGLFAIAFVTDMLQVISSIEPCFDISSMQEHLIECLENKKLIKFPKQASVAARSQDFWYLNCIWFDNERKRKLYQRNVYCTSILPLFLIPYDWRACLIFMNKTTFKFSHGDALCLVLFLLCFTDSVIAFYFIFLLTHDKKYFKDCLVFNSKILIVDYRDS